jgi:Ti-type conjugative transfer relaxase TraA
MAICQCRIVPISRNDKSNSRVDSAPNACRKAAYYSRSLIQFEGNCVLEPQTFDFRNAKGHFAGGILLPEGVDEKFLDSETLWNHASQKEKRWDAQEALDGLVALPNDKEITEKQREELLVTFLQKHFVDKGLAVQWDIHYSEKDGEPNWHGHFMTTTRMFSKDGKELAGTKARGLLNDIFRIHGQWPRHWTKHQDQAFERYGLSLRVDPPGLMPQEHQGPVRMRKKGCFELLERHEAILEINALEAQDPEKILSAITSKQSLFTKEDVERFCDKHTPTEALEEVKRFFWKQENFVPLLDKKSHQPTGKFSTQEVIAEEEKILRLATYLHNRNTFRVRNRDILIECSKSLSEEQAKAYRSILAGKGLSCIQGFAGTGKSRLLKSLSDTYIQHGFGVRAFGPDNMTAKVLKEKGIGEAENIHRFLKAEEHGARDIHKNREVWIVDEAGKTSNTLLLELFKVADRKGARVILTGDPNQLSPIGRGGIFKSLCDQFGFEKLEEVRRHEKEEDRKMNIELARGSIGAALDRLSSSGRIFWFDAKQESMEKLIGKWDLDREGGEKISFADSLILCASRREVKCFNEIAHLIRKSRGELGKDEFLSTSIHGKIHVSEGDVIQFRENDPELKIMNGERGVLIKASEKTFLVAVKENEKTTKLVSFDPKTFHGYQLGYATTTFSSQGDAAKRVYVQHSRALNRQMAYTALTRHFKDVFYFVSKDEASSLSELKRQARRDSVKQSTIDYTNPLAESKQTEFLKREQEIQSLKGEEAFKARLKGTTLQVWDLLKEKASEIKTRHLDRIADREPFEWNKDKPIRSDIVRLTNDELHLDPEKETQRILSREIHKAPFSDLEPANKDQLELPFSQAAEAIQEQAAEKNPHLKLSDQEKKLLNHYKGHAQKAFELKELVDAEKESFFNEKDLSKCTNFPAWQKACGLRNKAAYELKRGFRGNLEPIFGNRSQFILDQADRHTALTEKQSAFKESIEAAQNLSTKLSGNIEPLLYRLFPEGPKRRSQGGWRFGPSNHLSVKRDGTFFDFHEDKGGGPLQLIQKELGLDSKASKEWAQEFLGGGLNFEKPSLKRIETFSLPKENDWISLKPDPTIPLPGIRRIGEYIETARFPYKNAKGKLLYYVLRLENEEGKKITPPLSYGYEIGKEGSPYWKIKGFSQSLEEKKTLYHLEELKQKPLAPVLVVEGEKTADLAPAKMQTIRDKEYIAVTWPGGCKAALKADWTPLAGREVLIWPDNDAGGFIADKEIENALLKVGAKEIKTIDQGWLEEKFEKGWDLADSWPKGMAKSELLEKSRGIEVQGMRDVFLSRTNASSMSYAERLALTDIVCSYREGREDFIKQKLAGKSQYRKEESLRSEGHQIYKLFQKEEETRKRLGEDPQINASGSLQNHLARQCTLFEARQSRQPTLSEILMMKESIQEVEKELAHLPSRELPQGAMDLAKQRVFERVCVSAVLEGRLETRRLEEVKSLYVSESKEISLAETQEREISKMFAKEMSKERERDFSFGPSL